MTKQEEKRQAIETLKGCANNPKHDLMTIADKLEEIGAIREAKSLGTIIWKLEAWQH